MGDKRKKRRKNYEARKMWFQGKTYSKLRSIKRKHKWRIKLRLLAHNHLKEWFEGSSYL
jgi:hypothetical protein